MNCDHDIVEITAIGDTFHRGLCIKCNDRFVGPRITTDTWIDDGPWKTDIYHDEHDDQQRATSGTGEDVR